MQAFFKFNKGILIMPIQWQLWLLLLVSMNMILPIFFWEHLEAKIVLGTLLASMMLMTFLTALSGFTRLLGLGHVFWIPLLFFLWCSLDQIPSGEPFGIWIRGLMVLNALSLVFDVTDVVRFISGDREETVVGL